MKKIFVFIFLVCSITVAAQLKNSSGTASEPVMTEIGKLSGAKSEKMIGKEGGNIFSADGKVELKIPAGALAKNTVVSIQPIVNMAPNGKDKAYRLEPSGIKFQQPVQLSFHYTTEKGNEDAPFLKGIAMQGENHQWYYLKKTVLDTLAKTISGNIDHFSDWSTFESLQIQPASSRLKVNKTLELGVHHIGPSQGSDDLELSALDDGLLVPLHKEKYMSIEKWTVNGITNGNSSVGTTRVVSNMEVTYKAPSAVPDKNPVAIVAHLKDLDFSFNGKKFNDLRLYANVLIYDNAYEVKMFALMKGGTAASWAGEVTYKDEGSFIVSFDKGKAEVIDVVNNPETLLTNCNMTVYNPETCTGILHITGIKAKRVIPAQPPGNAYATIEILFIPGQTEHIKFDLDCPPPPGSKGRGQTKGKAIPQSYLLDVRIPALPVAIKFLAKPEEQIIYEKKEGSEMHIKFSVKQIKDD